MEKESVLNQAVSDRYEILTPLDNREKVFLVRDSGTGEIMVEKINQVHDIGLYKRLKYMPVSGIPAIREIDEVDGKQIVIEEYIHGKSLKQLLERDGVFREDTLVPLMTALCDIVDKLHEMNPPIIHRDIKPGNIILSNDDKIYLIDFDVSRVYKPDSELDTSAMVSHHFSAPELYGFGQSDPRSDIFSIGATMHYLLTGGYLKDKAYDGPLKAVIDKCCEMDPGKRFRNVKELKKALEQKNGRASWLPPGFRTGNPFKMAVAVVGYIFIAWCCFAMELSSELREPYASYDIGIQKTFLFVFCLVTVLILFDYRGIQDHLPFGDLIRPKWLKIALGIFIALSILFTVLCLVVLFLSDL